MKLNYQLAHQRLLADSADKKVLELLSATKGFQLPNIDSLSAKQFLNIAHRLELTEASVRMALSRQTKQGKLTRDNGRYTLTRNQNPFVVPRFWLDIRHRCVDWQQDWLLVSFTDTKLSTTVNRKLARRAELLGLKFVPNLGWIRPNNLNKLQQEVDYDLSQVTGHRDFLCAILGAVDDTQQQKFQQYWPLQQLNQFYTDTSTFIENEISSITGLTDNEILKRSFAIGRLLVEQLSLDPWLPEEMIDAEARERLFYVSNTFYQQIKPAWLNILAQE